MIEQICVLDNFEVSSSTLWGRFPCSGNGNSVLIIHNSSGHPQVPFFFSWTPYQTSKQILLALLSWYIPHQTASPFSVATSSPRALGVLHHQDSLLSPCFHPGLHQLPITLWHLIPKQCLKTDICQLTISGSGIQEWLSWSHCVFYDLALEVTHHHLQNIPWFTWVSPPHGGRGPQRVWMQSTLSIHWGDWFQDPLPIPKSANAQISYTKWPSTSLEQCDHWSVESIGTKPMDMGGWLYVLAKGDTGAILGAHHCGPCGPFST